MPGSTDRSFGRTKCQAGRLTGGEDYSPLSRGLGPVLVSRPATTNTSFCVPFAEAPYAAEYEPISEPAEFIADAQSARQARTAGGTVARATSVPSWRVGTNRVEKSAPARTRTPRRTASRGSTPSEPVPASPAVIARHHERRSRAVDCRM